VKRDARIELQPRAFAQFFGRRIEYTEVLHIHAPSTSRASILNPSDAVFEFNSRHTRGGYENGIQTIGEAHASRVYLHASGSARAHAKQASAETGHQDDQKATRSAVLVI